MSKNVKRKLIIAMNVLTFLLVIHSHMEYSVLEKEIKTGCFEFDHYSYTVGDMKTTMIREKCYGEFGQYVGMKAVKITENDGETHYQYSMSY